MEKNRAIVHLTAEEPEIQEDLILPLDVPAEDLIRGLNEAFHLGLAPEDLKRTFLKAEDPLALVRGSRTLSWYGIRNGSCLCLERQPALAAEEDLLEESGQQPPAYHRRVFLSGLSSFRMGGAPQCQLRLESPEAAGEEVLISRHGEGWIIQSIHTRSGVYVNGRRVSAPCALAEKDFLQISGYQFCFARGDIYTESRRELSFHGVPWVDNPLRAGYPCFRRSTRIHTVLNRESIEILDPPPLPEKTRTDWVLRLLPVVSMLVTAGALALMGGLRMLVFAGVSAAMAALAIPVTLMREKKGFRDSLEKREERYLSYIQEKKQFIAAAREEEALALEKIYIPPEEAARRVEAFAPELFDRTAGDEDFLCLRLGSGRVRAEREVRIRGREQLVRSDELSDLPEKTRDYFEFLPQAPVVVDLKSTGSLGILGTPECRRHFLRNLVMDLCVRQHFSDLRLMIFGTEDMKEMLSWVRPMPHLFCDELKTPALALTRQARKTFLEILYREVSRRDISRRDISQWEMNGEFAGHTAVFFLDHEGLRSHPVFRYCQHAEELGFTFFFFAASEEEIPVGCRYLVKLSETANPRGSGELIPAADGERTVFFRYPRISLPRARHLASLLAPVYSEEITLESGLPESYTFYDMLKIENPRELDLDRRYLASDVTRSLAAPLGISLNGRLMLDISEHAHGPHGLVAGTTGSGKSEILQTYVLSMASRYHPHEVGFVIIDFKGGGMAAQLRQLPHLMGVVTNIDGSAMERFMKSIRAELVKRQQLFALAGVNDISRYIAGHRAGKNRIPLPHLIMIVDEFAELKAEHPDFMKELISAARIGRSLGVHLILATQKPAGQVDEQIWSNSRFRLCLRVQSREDSNEVLKSPLAAEIREPGRAYLQVGNNEVFELFQSAYSGAPAEKSRTGQEFSILQITDTGRNVPVYERKKPRTLLSVSSQMEETAAYIAGYCRKAGIEKLPEICLPALTGHLEFPDLSLERDIRSEDFCLPLGMVDDPDRQRQEAFSLDLTASPVLIIGSSQSGKTALLETLICGAAEKYTPEEVNIYIIDFASMALKVFEDLPQVGGVVTAAEDEKLKNLFRLLRSETDRRRNLMLTAGAGDFPAGHEAGDGPLPRILLLIDNLAALRELFPQESEELLTLCREGSTFGISLAAAGTHTSGIGYRFLAAFGQRIALTCHDESEYGVLFDHCRKRPENLPGRALIEADKQYLECQVYEAFPGEKEMDRIRAKKSWVTDVRLRYKETKAPVIPRIPEILPAEQLMQRMLLEQRDAGQWQIAAGLDYATVEPWLLDLGSLGMLGISGKRDQGIRDYLIYLLEAAFRLHPGKMRAWVLEGAEKKLECLRNRPYVQKYSSLPSDIGLCLEELEGKLKSRQEKLLKGEGAAEDLLMLLADSPEALTLLNYQRTAAEAFRNITGIYQHLNVCLILRIDNQPVSFSAPEAVRLIRDRRQLLFFDDLSSLRIFEPSLVALREHAKPLRPGDAYYLRDNLTIRLKTPGPFGDRMNIQSLFTGGINDGKSNQNDARHHEN